MKRRSFIKKSAVVGAATGALLNASCDREAVSQEKGSDKEVNGAVVASTWSFGIEANEAAMEVLKKDGKSIDAVEAGVRITEADAGNSSVGIGGLPDRDGKVTLDACIMNEEGNAGSVSFLQNILHPISVARKVMDETPHVMLSGAGALKFAKENGFKETNLLTADSENAWRKWMATSNYEPWVGVDNHDTIGLLAKDKNNNLSGACTTSGLAYKMHGRVGDSPIIGAAIFVDNEIGCATATGVGELVMKTLGSFLIVELMRQGASPIEACKEAIARIKKKEDTSQLQVGYLAMSKKGQVAGFSIKPGFEYALYSEGINKLVKAEHLEEW